jgi:class 3 adenylate cyclase
VLAGMMAPTVSVVNDILFAATHGATSLFGNRPLAPVFFGGFVVAYSVVLSHRHTEARVSAERLSRRLLGMNRALSWFIPTAFLKVLGKRSILEVKLGDCAIRDLTVLSCDIRGFTQLSSRLTSEQAFQFVNEFLAHVCPAIHRNRGHVDKFLGDGILALFPDSSEDAIRAAEGMLEGLDAWNARRAGSGFPPVQMGIGIHRGPLAMGIVGEGERMEATIISDTVNVASRVESLTKRYGCEVLITGQVLEGVAGKSGPGAAGATAARFARVETTTVSGRQEPLELYRLERGGGQGSRVA